MNCVISVEWKNYCVHFVLRHAYITSILFPLLQLCAVRVFNSEGISKFVSIAVANMKNSLTNIELPTTISEHNNCCYFSPHTVQLPYNTV